MSACLLNHDHITLAQFVKPPEDSWQSTWTIQVTVNHCTTTLARNRTTLVPANTIPLIACRDTQCTIRLYAHRLDQCIHTYFRNDQVHIISHIQWRRGRRLWSLMCLAQISRLWRK